LILDRRLAPCAAAPGCANEDGAESGCLPAAGDGRRGTDHAWGERCGRIARIRAPLSGQLRDRRGRTGASVPSAQGRNQSAASTVYLPDNEEVSKKMLLLILLAVLAIVLFGLGFTLHWLFIIAVIAALVFLIMLFTGRAGGRTRGSWY
jgi:hypothetical protein